MTTPIKHADIVHAIADGIPVEFNEHPKKPWTEWDERYYSPVSYHGREWEWRIKPQPKPDTVIKTHIERTSATRSGVAIYSIEKEPNIKLVFDGETYELKEVSIIKGEPS